MLNLHAVLFFALVATVSSFGYTHTVTINNFNFPHKITVPVGDTLKIKLPSNPTTGFDWSNTNKHVLKEGILNMDKKWMNGVLIHGTKKAHSGAFIVGAPGSREFK